MDAKHQQQYVQQEELEHLEVGLLRTCADMSSQQTKTSLDVEKPFISVTCTHPNRLTANPRMMKRRRLR